MAQMMDDILNSKDDDLMKDFHELMKEAIEEESKVAQNEGRAVSESMTRLIVRQKVSGSMDKDEAINASRLVRRPLERIVMDLNKSTTTWHERGANIDVNRLALVPAGCSKVFMRKSTSRSPLTAISILVDNSGSMGAEKIRGQWVDSLRNINTANACSYALAYSLDKLKGVKSEVLYYPHRDNTVHLAKGFDEKVQSCTKHFQVQPQGATPTGPSMMAALRSIALRPEPKKIMFVLTDGDPDDSDSVRDALEAAKHLGVQVVAFGIGNDASQVRGFEDGSFVWVEDISSLHLAVKEVISNSLIVSA
jgi:cobalamin biosynthesis protein CobT